MTSLINTGPERQLQVDDLIVKIDGKQLQGASDFQWREFSAEPGTRWRLDLLRGHDDLSVIVTLQALTQEAFARRPSGRSQP